jgi:hypothetical protein
MPLQHRVYHYKVAKIGVSGKSLKKNFWLAKLYMPPIREIFEKN